MAAARAEAILLKQSRCTRRCRPDPPSPCGRPPCHDSNDGALRGASFLYIGGQARISVTSTRYDYARSAVFLDHVKQGSGIAGTEVNTAVTGRTTQHRRRVGPMNGVAALVEQRIRHRQLVSPGAIR